METDVEYIGHDLNEQHYEYDRDEGPRKCARYCEDNYPEAIYFSWVSYDWDYTGEDHLELFECWCKSEGAINDKKEVKGVISGTIECGVDTSSAVGEQSQNYEITDLQGATVCPTVQDPPLFSALCGWIVKSFEPMIVHIPLSVKPKNYM